MNGSGKIELPGGKEEVFKSLLEPELLQECMMGCKKLVLIEENKYNADLSVGIAAVKGKYEAVITVEDVVYPDHYKIIVEGEGKPGFVNAEGLIDLTSLDNGNTMLEYTYTAEVGGKVASIGQRMLSGVAKLIINDFFKKTKKELQKRPKSA